MSTSSRNGYRWTVREILSLQREFELLEWDIDTIAKKHKRTPDAIMYKLDQEGFADYNVLFQEYHESLEKEEYEEIVEMEEEEESTMSLLERIDGLEESISEMKDMIQKMIISFQNVK